MACVYVQAVRLKMQARASILAFQPSGSEAGILLPEGARRLSGVSGEKLMTKEKSGLEKAIELMETALGCLADPKDQVVAIRLSHALDLARERLLEGS